MSSMKLTKAQDQSLQDSRRRLRQALDMAFGSYVEQEATKFDNWREETFGAVFDHLKHEVLEIRRSKTRTTQLHNAIDACMLSAILVAKILEREEAETKSGQAGTQK